MRHAGFLYGHYDSRGGTTFMIAADREEADRAYLSSFGYDPDDPAEIDVSADDFLCAAVLESPIEDFDQDTEDLEVEDGVVLLLVGDQPWDGASEEEYTIDVIEEELRAGRPITLLHVEGRSLSVSVPSIHPRWNDDAFSFCVVKAQTVMSGS